MVENNYDILKIHDGATKKEIRHAYRNLVLKFHVDRGGDDEQFKKIKQAYEDLQLGKKYPDTLEESREKSKVYSGDLDEDKRRKNILLSQDITKEMKSAQEWAEALNRADTCDMRLFGSNELGKIEFERKPTKTLTIKGKFWAGHLRYNNTIMMWGSITNPYFSPYEKHKTHIHVTNGSFKLIDSLQNNYDIDGGAKITVDNGDIEVGNVRGKKTLVQDPQGRVGRSVTREHFTSLSAIHGKLVTGSVTGTVKLNADTVIVLNLSDNVKVTGKNILVYGTKVTHDTEFFLKSGGKIRFYDQGSGFDISDDATIQLENSDRIKIRDLKHANMISNGGKDITYEYLANRDNKKQSKTNSFEARFSSLGKVFGK